MFEIDFSFDDIKVKTTYVVYLTISQIINFKMNL